jgi:predicted ester cyclase
LPGFTLKYGRENGRSLQYAPRCARVSVLPKRRAPAHEERRTHVSEEENKAVVWRIYEELWDERNLEVADELIAQGAVNYDTGLVPRPFGPEEMKDTVRMVSAAFPDRRHELEDVFAEDDRVMARVRLSGTHEGPFMGIPPTGRRIEVGEIHVYRLRNGKAVEHRVGRDDLGAMRQLCVVADAVPSPTPPRPE